MFDYTTSLKRTFTPRKHELNSELRVTRSDDSDLTSIWRAPVTGAGQIERQRDNLDALTTQLNAQLDYTRPLGKTAKLETGYKGTARWLDREFLVEKDSLGTGTWARSSLSNDFQFDEQVNAVYGVVSRGVKKVELQGGLRAEYASRDFSLASGSYPYNYTSFFPSGVVSYNRSAKTQMKASYSRRIRRPGTQELNPFPSFFDVQNVFIGNPQLSPEYTDAIEFGFTRNMSKGMIQLSPFYRYTTDIIRVDINAEDVVDGREVTTISFRNLATSNSWGTDLNGQLRLGPKLNGFAGFNVFKMVTDGGSTSSLGSDAVTWMGRVNGTTQLTKTFSFQGSYFYRAPMKIERGKFDRMQMVNFSFRQKLDGDKATVTLRVNDPFNTGGMRIRAGDGSIVQITERNFGSRTAFLTFQYSYGQAPRIREPRQDAQPEPQARFP
jgi:outer membrane receptor protein involved in Fe transport